MANIVLGIAASHSPQVSTSWEYWPSMSRTSQVGSNAPADVAAELEPDMQRDRFTATQRALSTLSAVLRNVQNLDAIVVFGDDQHELMYYDNYPSISVLSLIHI